MFLFCFGVYFLVEEYIMASLFSATSCLCATRGAHFSGDAGKLRDLFVSQQILKTCGQNYG